jgi:hypothetical protein
MIGSGPLPIFALCEQFEKRLLCFLEYKHLPTLPTQISRSSLLIGGSFLGECLYGAKILPIARNQSGGLPVIIVDDTFQEISFMNRFCYVTYWPGKRKALT